MCCPVHRGYKRRDIYCCEEILEIMEAKQVILIRSRSRNTASPLEKKLRLNDLIYKTIEIQSSGQYMCFLSLSLSRSLHHHIVWLLVL